LDVGSGPGFFLLHGKQRGWKTVGIEPSARAAEHSRSLGLDIIEGFLTKRIADKLGTFDVVNMSNVLEHIPEPKMMLDLVWDLLNPRGLICLVVPNDYNPFQHALKSVCGYEPWWVAPPHHINYFEPESLRRLTAASRFEVILCESTFPIDIFLLMGDNYIGNDELGRQCHKKRINLEKNLAMAGLTDLKRKMYQLFAQIGVGRNVQVIGLKK
jgi:SAM-dependent methyltransferase